MMTSIAKSCTWGCTLSTSWATPTAITSSSIFSGTRRRSATAALIPSATRSWMGQPAWRGSCAAAATCRQENPNRMTAQKVSTPVGCLRMKS